VSDRQTAKALSIRQPWLWAITHLDKRVENRTRATRHRGRVWLHASAKVGRDVLPALYRRLTQGEVARAPDDYTTGAIVAVAELVDCLSPHGDVVRITAEHCNQARWMEPDTWKWVLAGVQRLPRPVPCNGKLGLWPVPPEILYQCEQQLQTEAGEKESAAMSKSKSKPKTKPKAAEPGDAHADLGYGLDGDGRLSPEQVESLQTTFDVLRSLAPRIQAADDALKTANKAARAAKGKADSLKAKREELRDRLEDIGKGKWDPALPGMDAADSDDDEGAEA